MRRWTRAIAACPFLLTPASALADEPGFLDQVDALFGAAVVAPLASVLFYDVWFWDNGSPEEVKFPVIVAWLVLGALFFTLRMGFVSIWAFPHALRVTAGQFDEPGEAGEISSFQALSSALSATVGLGNIAGVAIAVSSGGPGAVFWMVVAAFLGMSSKFTEVTLGQMYRKVDSDGTVSGGPMHYLRDGLAELGHAGLGRALSVLFAVLCIGGSFGGGNMFQANQSFAAVADQIPFFADKSWLWGILLAALVAAVILGGIKRIGAAAGFIVPFMVAVYVLGGVLILVVNAAEIPAALALIFERAFEPRAVGGGALGAMAVGFQRAAFSNEAGVGSASIAHSAATTAYPVREGVVGLLEPFIDTVVVCTMTGLVVVTTGTWQAAVSDPSLDGVVVTSRAFATVLPWFPAVLTLAVVLFAFSTMISWSYYGERCTTFLFGEGARTPYRVVFVGFVFLGSVLKLGSVLDFSDLMILGMAGPNVLGAVLLSGKVRAALDRYWQDLRAGAFTPSP
jgi:AGCS family alanine or glycine:cation symporter